MTIFFPDVSQYTPNVDPAKYPALLARATLSDRVADPTYAGFKAKAAAAGTVFGAYHWLNHGNLQRQAAWCFQHVGPETPVMIDAEDVAGNTGYAGPLTVDDLLGFTAEYRALGGIVSLAYLPFWYWSGAMGAPHRLGELAAAGLGLVSSNYPNAGYTETGPGWARYYPGAPVPVQWQYTSTPIDMNAYRGTVAEYAAVLGGVDAASIGGEAMGAYEFEISDRPGAQYLGCLGGGFYPLRSTADYEGDNLAPHIPVGPFTYEQARRIFGPELQWEPVAGPPGKDGAPGPAGPPGPKGDIAVLAAGTTLIVGPQS